MDARLSNLADWEIALMLSSLMDDKASMRNRLVAEAGYRLMRSSHGKMTQEQEALIDELTTFRYRQREGNRNVRRIAATRIRALQGGSIGKAGPTVSENVVCIR